MKFRATKCVTLDARVADAGIEEECSPAASMAAGRDAYESALIQ